MLYLFDANVLITASNVYYPLDQIPEFWSWVEHQATIGNVKIPLENLEEILEGRKSDDPLLDWLSPRKDRFSLDEAVEPAKVQYVVARGYAPDLTDDEIEELGRDPFLIAYALNRSERCVVTTEVSKPSRKRHKRHVPDVCRDLAINCQNPFHVYRALGFRTGWR
ncbi:MAG: DUF4411 family protein [Bryobacterales bacterium]|nr:DUF4411 family protein [Bryobacterales bacterium]